MEISDAYFYQHINNFFICVPPLFLSSLSGLQQNHVGSIIADHRGPFIVVGGNRDISASPQAFVGTQDTQLKIVTVPTKPGRLVALGYRNLFIRKLKFYLGAIQMYVLLQNFNCAVCVQPRSVGDSLLLY